MAQSSANLRQTLQRLQGAVDTMRSLHQLLLDRIEFVRVGGESVPPDEREQAQSQAANSPEVPHPESEEEEQGRVDRSITLMMQTLALREQLQANLAALGDTEDQGPNAQGCPLSVLDSLPRVRLPRKLQCLALVDGCAICQSDMTDLRGEGLAEMVEFCLLPCNHRFCFGCIQPWLKACHTCPICRFALVEGCAVAPHLADAFQRLAYSSSALGRDGQSVTNPSVTVVGRLNPVPSTATEVIFQGRLRPASSNPTRGGTDGSLNRRMVLRPQTAAIGPNAPHRTPQTEGRPAGTGEPPSEYRQSMARPYSALVGPATMSMRRKFLSNTLQSNSFTTSTAPSALVPPMPSTSVDQERESKNPIVGGSSITLSRRPPSASVIQSRSQPRPQTASRNSLPLPFSLGLHSNSVEPRVGRLGSALPPRPSPSVATMPDAGGDATPSSSLPVPRARPMIRPQSSMSGLTRESRTLLKRIDSQASSGRAATVTNLTFPGPPLEHVPARLRFS